MSEAIASKPFSVEDIVVDGFYRPTAREIFSAGQAAQIMNQVMITHILTNENDVNLADFVHWAVQNNKLEAPKFPGIINERVYLYYHKMYDSVSEKMEEFRNIVPSLLEEYNAATGENFHIEVPSQPSKKWIDVMQPTSIAMGKIFSGIDESFEKLSPAGIIWRSDSVRGLIDSLEHASQNKFFSTFCMFRPEVLPQYFMKCHPEVYFGGRVPFGSLMQSDVMLICKAAASTLLKEGSMEVLIRAAQLAVKSVQDSSWVAWVKHGIKEFQYEFLHLTGHNNPTVDLPDNVKESLNMIIDCQTIPEHQVIACLGRKLSSPKCWEIC